jgi:hypothetical protein
MPPDNGGKLARAYAGPPPRWLSNAKHQQSSGGACRFATVQFSVVGATSRAIAFAAVHVQFAPPTVHKSVVL